MAIVRTVCPLDCWDACGMLAHVQDGRVTKLEGDPDHPIARGALCSRTYRYPARVDSPERILEPMRRVGGSFVQTSWDDALLEIVSRLDALRRERRTLSLLHVQSSGSMGVLKRLSSRFFKLLGGVTVAEGDFCLGAGKTALERQLGDYRPHAWDDCAKSRVILLWGRDPLISGPHRMQFLKEARERGASVISINPLSIARPPIVSETFRLRPGTDGWLAAGMAKVLIDEGLCASGFIEKHGEGFERFRELLSDLSLARVAEITGLGQDEVRRLAFLYAEADPASILFGTGGIRYRNGLESAIWVTALPALMGYYGREGGGLSYSLRHMRDTDCERWESPAPHDGAEPVSRAVSAGAWHHELDRLDPPIEMLWVNGANPAAMLPDSEAMTRALAHIPFKVVVDFHWTDTARQADLVLPHPSFLEESGLVTSWGHAWVAWQARAIEPRGSSRSDLEIFQALAERLGFGEEMSGSPEVWSRRLMGDRLKEKDWKELLHGRGHVKNTRHEAVPYSNQRFPREGGRYLFPDAALDPNALPQRDEAHPFLLLTPKNRTRHLSQTLPADEPDRLRGTMAEDVARAVGRSSGCFRLASRHGAIEVELELDPDLQAGLIVVPAGGSVQKRTAVNLLTGPECAEDGVTAAYFDCPVALSSV